MMEVGQRGLLDPVGAAPEVDVFRYAVRIRSFGQRYPAAASAASFSFRPIERWLFTRRSDELCVMVEPPDDALFRTSCQTARMIPCTSTPRCSW
jgi:hypothetical protein